MSTYLVTGVAGFIASKVAEMLLADGHTVVGVDNLNDYYDIRLKYYRLARLAELSGCEASQRTRIKEAVEKPDGALGAEMAKQTGRRLGADGEAKLKAEVSGTASASGPKSSAFSFQPSAFSGGQPATAKFQLSLKSARFEFRVLDIENLAALEEVFKAHKFEAVFNLAARAGVRYSIEFPELYRRTNVLGEENVLKCQVRYGVKKHVLASSSSVYAGCPMPFVEDAVLGRMQSPYAGTKRQAELLALDYHQQHGIDVSALRYFTVFGPAGRPDMAPLRFIKWIDEGTPITLYGDGTQSRDFTYVDDIARGTILAGKLFGGQMREQKPETGNLKPEDSNLNSDSKPQMSEVNSAPPTSGFRFQVSGFPDVAPGYEVINLGGGRNPISLHTVIGFIEKALGKKATISGQPPSAADMKETWADITRAERLLGWKPRISPEEGFQRTVEWHVANRAWLKDIKL